MRIGCKHLLIDLTNKSVRALYLHGRVCEKHLTACLEQKKELLLIFYGIGLVINHQNIAWGRWRSREQKSLNC